MIHCFFAVGVDSGNVFHVLGHDDPQNGPKIGRVSIDAVQMEENCDQRRIPHDLKPLTQRSFCFWWQI